jgi:hypothetical protein
VAEVQAGVSRLQFDREELRRPVKGQASDDHETVNSRFVTMMRAMLVLTLLPATVAVASAQSGESVAILEHIIAEIRRDTTFPYPGPLGVDRRIFLRSAVEREAHGGGPWATRAPQDLAKLAAIPGVTLTSIEDARQCGPTLESGHRCRLEGVATLLAFATPTVAGDTATVHMIGLTNSTGGRSPIDEQYIRYILVRTATGWRVTDRRILAGT